MTDQDCIDSVMNWFDFADTAKMMEAVNFGWTADIDFSESFLREWVLKQIRECHARALRDGGKAFSGTGGFEIKWEGVGTDKPWLAVCFTPCEWDAGG